MNNFFDIDEKIKSLAKKSEERCRQAFERIDDVASYNENKVLKAFADNRISTSHLIGTTGYGYDDMGRDTLDKVFAQSFGAEDALVRHSFVSGTHALTVALFGVLRTGDTLVAVTGAPYDTLEEVIGIRGEGNGSLKDYGINYRQVDLKENGKPDLEKIKSEVVGAKVAHIQRSRGYSFRPSLTVDEIGEIVSVIKEASPETIVFVDNCYGEFVEKKEPTEVGADLIVGSLIKNPGGGIAETGGYIAGKSELIEQCAYRLTSPGIGREAGCSLNQNRSLYMGFFYAPSVVANAVKVSVFASALLSELGFSVYPHYDEYRTDIIAAIALGTPDKMVAFCQGIQKGSPIDAYVSPEPWAMPGYDSEVIMAAGAFTMGSSIELSADGPLREPYAVWLQGGLTYNTGKTGVLLAVQSMYEKGLIDLN